MRPRPSSRFPPPRGGRLVRALRTWGLPAFALPILALTLVALEPAVASAQLLRRASGAVRSDESPRRESRGSGRGSTRERSRDDSAPRGSHEYGGGGYRQRHVGVHPRFFMPRAVYIQTSGVDDVEPVYDELDGPPEDPPMMFLQSAEVSYVLESAVRASVGLRWLLEVPMEVHADYQLYVEPLPRSADLVGIGRVGASFRAVDHGAVQLRLGGSLRTFSDRLGTRAGGELSIGMDIFFDGPLIATLMGSAGIVGNAWILEGHATIGIVFDRAELYVAWHQISLFGLDDGTGVDLSGPGVGLRFWL